MVRFTAPVADAGCCTGFIDRSREREVESAEVGQTAAANRFIELA